MDQASAAIHELHAESGRIISGSQGVHCSRGEGYPGGLRAGGQGEVKRLHNKTLCTLLR
jgi:hypothetical protein